MAVIAVSAPARAEIRLPLTIPYVTMDEALKAQLYTSAGNRADLWRESDCRYLYSEKPRLSSAGNLLRLESEVDLNVGTRVGDNCINAVSWQGIAEIVAAPYVSPDWKLKLRVADMNLYDLQHQKTVIASRGFDLIKSYFVPRVEQFSYDLKSPLMQVTQLVAAGTPDQYRPDLRQAFATLSTVPPVIASRQGLRVVLRMSLPAGMRAPTIAPRSEALTHADVVAWQNALDHWDAFVVFAVKQIGGSTSDREFREDLLDLLLDSRHRLVTLMTEPQPGDGPDPVRMLFIDTWSRFDRIVQNAAIHGLLGNRTLEFLSFLSAGDALIAFDRAAPAIGMRINAAELRGLAHILAPSLRSDPLTFSFDEDPELQKLFGIRPPLATPEAVPEERDGAPDPAMPAGSSSAGVLTDYLGLLASWVMPDAWAAPQTVTIDDEIRSVARRLDRRVAEPGNLQRYTADIGHLLDLSTSREVGDDYLEAQYGATMRRLVRSAAWQESCWRQFVRRNRRIVYLQSSTHDLGLMQVNQYVWRGFYSIPRLKWDIAYNAGAGAQILLRRLGDCARYAAGHGVAASSDDLVRSAYSAYNGGPAACNRWDTVGVPSEKALIDVSFWLKYQALEQGQQLDVLQCAAQWDRSVGH